MQKYAERENEHENMFFHLNPYCDIVFPDMYSIQNLYLSLQIIKTEVPEFSSTLNN